MKKHVIAGAAVLAVAIVAAAVVLKTQPTLRGDVGAYGTGAATQCQEKTKIITLPAGSGGPATTVFKATANAMLAKQDDAKGNAQAKANAETTLGTNCSAQVGISGLTIVPQCDPNCTSATTVAYRTKTTKATYLRPFKNTSGQWQYGADVEGECYAVRTCSTASSMPSSPGRRLEDDSSSSTPDTGMYSSPGTTFNPDGQPPMSSSAPVVPDPSLGGGASTGLNSSM